MDNREEMIEVPRWILDNAKEALRQNYNYLMSNESCLKRMTAKAHNYLNAYLHGKATKDEINDISLHYIMANLRHYE